MNKPARLPVLRDERVERVDLWIPLLLGLLLMLAAAISSGTESSFSAKRTERFGATLPPRSTVRVENVSGDILASAGKEFSALVTTTVAASSQRRAEQILDKTKIVQSREGDELSIESRWPDWRGRDSRERTTFDRGFSMRWRSSAQCDCRINAKYELVIPPDVDVVLKTVNGNVRVRDLEGAVDLGTVNGDVVAEGTRQWVTGESVNGRIVVATRAVPADSSLQLKTVNGPITLTLPKDAKFHLSASTMSGTIASSFPLPSRDEGPEEMEPKTGRAPRVHVPRRVIVKKGDGESVIVDLRDLEKELDQSMREVEVEIRESLRNAERELRHIRILDPRYQYTGSIGQGGAKLRLSTFNGAITLLASGTRESEAKPLVSRRPSISVTVPRIVVRDGKPTVRIESDSVLRAAPRALIVPGEADAVVVRGDISGDFLSTNGGGSYRIGKVSGRVKILTNAGEVHVASAGTGADLKSYGGDIQIGSVSGDLKAQTLAGDIRAGSVSGFAKVETSGGDIRIERVNGPADARTAGGDIILSAVGGGVEAETNGGEVRIAVISREARGGITIRNSGGDVTLTLPADFRGDVDLAVAGASPSDDPLIRSDFSEIELTRLPGSQRASGILNGGGTKVRVHTRSGSIRLRKSPAAGS